MNRKTNLNMKTFLCLSMTAVLFLALAYAATAVAQVPAVVVGNPRTTDGHTTDSIGFLFNVGKQPISVSDLGFWDAGSNGLNSAHDVGIFRQSDRALMVRGTVASGVGSPLDDGFRYVSVPETILEAGELYQAVAYRPAGTTDLIGFNFNQFSPASEITIPHAVFEFGTGELTFATINRPEDGFLGANFKFEAVPEVGPELQAGDADQDFDFDQLDLVKVQVANKYLTGQAATWGEGDWDAAPGGSPGSPPAGDGLFNQFDIIAANVAGVYLQGPYAALQTGGEMGDGQTSVIYNASTGEVAVDAPIGVDLTSVNIDSAAGIFTGDTVQNLGGSFDNDSDNNIFKATFGSSFGSLSFGNVAQSGLSEEFVLGDLSVVGSLAGGGDLGNVDLVYVPEPTSILLLTIGTLIGLLHFRRASR